jgi:hypothetical protein
LFAIGYLMAFGQEARMAVPKLVLLLADSSNDLQYDYFSVRERAADALGWIDPVTAGELGLDRGDRDK